MQNYNVCIEKELFELSEEKYMIFQSKLCPGVDNIIGVRMPLLRKIAKRISKSDWQKYLSNAKDDYYEEVMLQGLVIGYVDAELSKLLEYVDDFVPKIGNWAVCDSFCGNLKASKGNLELVFDYIQKYLKSDKEFEIRFAVVMLLEYFVNDEYIDKAFEIFNNIKHDGYYVKMSIAWAISKYFVFYPEKTMSYLKDNKLCKFTYNKSLQKIVESLRVDKDTKETIKSMKI